MLNKKLQLYFNQLFHFLFICGKIKDKAFENPAHSFNCTVKTKLHKLKGRNILKDLNSTTILIIVSIIAAAILLLVAFSALKKLRLRKIGKDGEKKVASVLKKYALLNDCKLINDLYLPLYDKSTQIDHILIGFFGILVIETKNVSGEIYGDPKKKQWLQIMGKKNQTKHEIYNPLMQNQTHIDCIRHHFGLENMYNINIESLVVFSSKKVQLYIPKQLPIIKLEKLKKYLRHQRFHKDNNFDVEKLYNTLLNHQIVSKNRASAHIKNVKEMSK